MGHRGNTFISAVYFVFVITLKPVLQHKNSPRKYISEWACLCPIKLYLQKRMARKIWSTDCVACQLLHPPCQHTIGSPDTFSQTCLKNICLQIITVFDSYSLQFVYFHYIVCLLYFFSGGPQTGAGITWGMEHREVQ